MPRKRGLGTPNAVLSRRVDFSWRWMTQLGLFCRLRNEGRWQAMAAVVTFFLPAIHSKSFTA